MLTFTKSFAPITGQKVAAFERSTDLQLPDDYKQFLLTTNGGIPCPNRFTVPGCGDALAGILYALCDPATPGDLEYELAQAQQYDPLPAGFLPIGHDPGGNTFLLVTLGEDGGRVYFWDRVGLWRKCTQNAFPTATSFTDFLNSLSE